MAKIKVACFFLGHGVYNSNICCGWFSECHAADVIAKFIPVLVCRMEDCKLVISCLQ